MAAWNFLEFPMLTMCLPRALPASWLQNSLTRMQSAGTTAQAHTSPTVLVSRVHSARELFMQAKEEFLGIALIEPHLLPLPRRLQFKPRVTRGELFCSLIVRARYGKYVLLSK